ncbi:MAG: diacylglycerol/lipid kinase family protein [Bryobacteraceae bacterium]
MNVFRKIGAIVNPASASGRTARRWPGIERALEQRLGSFETRFTSHSGHAIDIARRMADQGFDLVIAVGGDGTVNEVVNGLVHGVDARQPSSVTQALLPCGTGGDFQRTLGMPSRIPDAIAALASGSPIRMDLGKASFRDPEGRRRERLFVNLLSFGMGGEVASRARNWLSPLGGSAAFLYATAQTFFRYEPKEVSLRLDGGPPIDATVMNVAIGNGCFHGGGMHVCPRAALNDGAFDVTVIDNLGLLEILRKLPVLYSDNIYSYNKVHHYRAAAVIAESPQAARIELDGEPVGTLPAEVSILPAMLNVLVPTSAQAARSGIKGKKNPADLAAPPESVVREFPKSAQAARSGIKGRKTRRTWPHRASPLCASF